MMAVHLAETCSNKYYEHLLLKSVGQDSIVGTTTHYRLDNLGIKSQWRQDLPPVQTNPRAHPASYTTGLEGKEA